MDELNETGFSACLRVPGRESVAAYAGFVTRGACNYLDYATRPRDRGRKQVYG